MRKRKILLLGLMVVSIVSTTFTVMLVRASNQDQNQHPNNSVVVQICGTNGAPVLSCATPTGGSASHTQNMSFAFGTNSPPQPGFLVARKIAMSFVCSATPGVAIGGTIPATIFNVSLNGKQLNADNTKSSGAGFAPSTASPSADLFVSTTDCWFTLTITGPTITNSITNGVNILDITVAYGTIRFSGITAVIEY